MRMAICIKQTADLHLSVKHKDFNMVMFLFCKFQHCDLRAHRVSNLLTPKNDLTNKSGCAFVIQISRSVSVAIGAHHPLSLDREESFWASNNKHKTHLK